MKPERLVGEEVVVAAARSVPMAACPPSGLAAARPARGVRSTRTGADFDPLLPFETWSELGARISTYSNATAWWLGDWLAFGRMKYGRRYKQAIAATGLDYQTLRNYAVVARRFDRSRRRDDVSFQHHAEVCALSDADQDDWLRRAAAAAWSRNELRRRIRADAPAGSVATQVVRLPLAPSRLERWRAAAQLSHASLEGWMLAALDETASAALDARHAPSADAITRPAQGVG